MRNPNANLCIVSLSGGMDSATVLGVALASGFRPLAVAFQYGSKHNWWELEAAHNIAKYYNVGLKVIDVRNVFEHLKSALMDPSVAIPEGFYEGENMRQTVVPGRNLIFLSILAAEAESREIPEVMLGIHSGDHHIYPDCRPEFYEAARNTVLLSTDRKVDFKAPFLYGDKETIIRRGLSLGVPYHLTRTCHKSDTIACGVCGSCQRRLDAFAKCDVDDPIEYASRKLISAFISVSL